MKKIELPVCFVETRSAGNMHTEMICDGIVLPKHYLRHDECGMTQIPLWHAEPSLDGSWARCSNDVPKPARGFTSRRLVEEDDGLFKITKAGNILQSEARVHIVERKIIHLADGGVENRLVCEVGCRAWEDRRELIEISEADYKNIFAEIKKKFPELAIPASTPTVFDEYLAHIAKMAHDVPTVHESVLSGWLEYDGAAHFMQGTDVFYNHREMLHDNIPAREVVAKAQHFLAIGHNNATICLIWLAFHAAPSLFWLEKAGLAFRSTIFVRGGTGLLKTSVLRTVADIFNSDRQRAVIRLNSTLAGIQNVIAKLRDVIVCIDDFSNSEANSRNQAMSAAEAVIRAVGDGVFPTKCSSDDVKRTVQRAVRSVVVVTGEEGIYLGHSSNLRTLVLPVYPGTFDGKELDAFQRDPVLLRAYQAVFIDFLMRNGQGLIHDVRDRFIRYRDAFSAKIEVRRFSETGAILRVVVDFMESFLDEYDMKFDTAMFENAIERILKYSANEAAEEMPEQLFLTALKDLLGAKRFRIAPSEATYIADDNAFVGFQAPEGIWLRPHDTYVAVRKYFDDTGREFLVKPKRLKELLYEHGIIKGREDPVTHKREYVFKARKGSRKRMIIIKPEKIKM